MARLILARKCPVFRIKHDQAKLENTGLSGDEYRGHRISALKPAAARFPQAARYPYPHAGR
jgi:hypothetical protein